MGEHPFGDLDEDAAWFAVGGESAGRNLAAAVALQVRDEDGPFIDYQLIIRLILDQDFSRDSYREIGGKGLLTRANRR